MQFLIKKTHILSLKSQFNQTSWLIMFPEYENSAKFRITSILITEFITNIVHIRL